MELHASIYMALDETMKTILKLFTFDAANIEITCDQASQRKWENLRTAWSQVNEEKLDIMRDPLPAQDIIQQNFLLFSWLAYMLYRF